MGDKSPDIPQQNLAVDINKIIKSFKKQIIPTFHRWEQEPELKQLRGFTQQTMIPQLMGLLGNIPQAQQYLAPLQALLKAQPNIAETIAAPQQVMQQFQERMGNLMNVAPVLAKGLTTQAPIIESGGAPTMQQQHDAQQAALQTMSQGGNVYGNQAVAADILRRWQVQQQNMQNAIQNVTGLTGIQASDVAARLGLGQGITSVQQAIDALRSSDVNRRLGLITGMQGITGTDLAQRLGLMQGISGAIANPLQTGVSTFGQLFAPLMGFGGNVFDANQNAAAAQNIAGANKSSGLTSGILSSLGSVAVGVGTAV